jgi:hypothetical protein
MLRIEQLARKILWAQLCSAHRDILYMNKDVNSNGSMGTDRILHQVALTLGESYSWLR